ncbi:MAG: hypothetical protein ACLFWM_06950 [Actinomycetota bacterium]
MAIFYIDRSRIRDGALDEVKSRIRDVVDFIEREEPQLIAYDFYIDPDGSRMAVVAVHPDTESLKLHLQVGRTAFQGFAHLIDLTGIEVYGQPDDEALTMLADKAEMLGDGAPVDVHDHQAGFLRAGTHAS